MSNSAAIYGYIFLACAFIIGLFVIYFVYRTISDIQCRQPRVKRIFEDVLDVVNREDSGCAMLGDVINPKSKLFVRIHSWDSSGEHEEFKKFEGKKVRVTIEVIE